MRIATCLEKRPGDHMAIQNSESIPSSKKNPSMIKWRRFVETLQLVLKFLMSHHMVKIPKNCLLSLETKLGM